MIKPKIFPYDIMSEQSCKLAHQQLAKQYQITYLLLQKALLKCGMQKESRELGKVYQETKL